MTFFSRLAQRARSIYAPVRPFFESEYVAIAVLLVIAAFTRLYKLGDESFWLDEATTFERSRLPLPELVADAEKAYHNPTYFVLIHYWMKLGDSEAMLRLPSALFGILQVPVVYVLGRIVGGRFTAFAAALVLCLNQRSVHYGQEARMYALYCLGASVAMAALVWFAKHPDDAARPWRTSKKSESGAASASPNARRAWIAFVVGAIVALYCHATAVMFVTACSVVALVFLAVRRAERRGFFVNWVLANVIVLVAFGPWLPRLLGQTNKLMGSDFWLADPTTDSVFASLRSTFLFGDRSLVLTIFLGVFALVGTFALRKSPLVLAALWLLTILGPGLLLVASLRQSVFMPRLFLWSVAPFSVLVGAGIVATRRVALNLLFLTTFATLAGYWLNRAYYKPRTKPDWYEAINMVSQRLKSKERVIAIGRRERRLLRYYFERESGPIPAFEYQEVSGERDDVDELVGDARAVWTIQGRRWSAAERIRAELAKRGRRGVSRHFGGNVAVERYTIRSEKKREK